MLDEDRKVRLAPFWANALSSVARRLPAGRIMLSRWLRDRQIPTFVGRMPPRLGGAEFLCSPSDNIAYDVFFAGCWGPCEEAFIRSILRPGMSFVDVGANWGLYTLLAAGLVGADGKVLACEPDPRAYGKLQANLARNRFKQVQTCPLAVADRDADLPFAMHLDEAREYGTSRLAVNSESEAVRMVRSISLDGLLDQTHFDRVDLVKIDVEGAEALVLMGMDAGLRSGRYRRILLEVHPWLLAERGLGLVNVVDTLRSRGYVGFAFDCSPASRRRAIYARAPDFREFIRPLDQVNPEAALQTLWLADGVSGLS